MSRRSQGLTPEGPQRHTHTHTHAHTQNFSAFLGSISGGREREEEGEGAREEIGHASSAFPPSLSSFFLSPLLLSCLDRTAWFSNLLCDTLRLLERWRG